MLVWLLLGIVSGLSPQDCVLQLKNFEIDKACFNLLLSKFLGYSLVTASLILKFPQILKIYHNNSVSGISLTSFYIETLGFSIMAAYSIHNGQPISTYGEHAIISIQCVIQVILFWFIGKVKTTEKVIVGLGFTFFWVIPLFGELVPESFWTYVPIYVLLMNIVVKFSQIAENFKNGSTGNLSFITNFMNFLGVLSRIFTTFTELNDKMLLFNYTAGALMNGVIMAQFIVYWNSQIPQEKKKIS